MSNLITPLFTTATLISHFVFVILVLAFIFRKSWGKGVINFLGKNALLFGFLIALGGVAGSLSYSNIVGYVPCTLCWWQRIFVYPQVILFMIALKKRDVQVFNYSIFLSAIAGLIAAYHSYIHLGGHSVLPCTAVGSACAKVFVLQYGYITIPLMSLTICVYLLLISLIGKSYVKNNSNA